MHFYKSVEDFNNDQKIIVANSVWKVFDKKTPSWEYQITQIDVFIRTVFIENRPKNFGYRVKEFGMFKYCHYPVSWDSDSQEYHISSIK